MFPSSARQRSPIVRYFSNWYTNASQDLGLRVGIRLSQFALAITIMVLYSRDIKTFSEGKAPIPASWIYAQVVSSLSIIVCLWCTFINAKHRILRLLIDFVIGVLWAAQAGCFGMIYWRDDDLEARPPLANEKHMKGAVGVGLHM